MPLVLPIETCLFHHMKVLFYFGQRMDGNVPIKQIRRERKSPNVGIRLIRLKETMMMMMMIGVLGRVDCNGHFAPIWKKRQSTWVAWLHIAYWTMPGGVYRRHLGSNSPGRTGAESVVRVLLFFKVKRRPGKPHSEVSNRNAEIPNYLLSQPESELKV